MTTSSSITTGYGILGKNLIKGLLKEKVDIKYLGGQNIGHQKEDYQLSILDDIFGSDALDFYTKLYGIDYVLTIIDNWAQPYHYLPKLLKQLKVRHICHCTVNSLPIPQILISKIKDADFWVAPSKFVEKALLDAGFDPKRVCYVPHGIDSKIFKPLPMLEVTKHKEMIGYKDKFVFLAVATNKGFEKNWHGLFYAYKIFLTINPEAKEHTVLHCHTSPVYPEGYDLLQLSKMYGISENIRFLHGFSMNAGFPQEEMAKLYNVADCLVSSTMGESFGLPLLESMACGVPCIAPNHTTGSELVGEPETGLLADLLKMKNGQEYGWTGPTITDKWLVDPYALAECMTQIYKDKKLRTKFSKNALEFAKGFDWKKVIIKKWLDFLKYVESFREHVNYKEKKLGI